jgi:hypothetical protein
VYPLQLILVVFFYGIGSWMFTGQLFPYSGAELVELLRSDLWGSIAALWDSTFFAVLLWLIISPFIVLVAYSVFYRATARFRCDLKMTVCGVKRPTEIRTKGNEI